MLEERCFQASVPASLAVTVSKDKTSAFDKLYDHSNYVHIWQKSQAACM